jgi:phage major head subunit gpT-like protein
MPQLLTAELLASAYKGFNLTYQNWYGSTPTTWERIASPTQSTTAEEVYPWLGQNTAFREWIGPRVYQNLQTHGFTIKNRLFENTVSVDRTHLEDDKLGIYAPVFGQLGQDSKKHPDILVWEVAANADKTVCYDGQYLLDTDHPVGNPDGTTSSVSNYFPGNDPGRPLWMLICTTKVMKPFIYQKRRPYNLVSRARLDDPKVFDENVFVYGVDGRAAAGVGLWQLVVGSREPLTLENYGKVKTALQGFRNDKGVPLDLKGDLLVVPNVLEQSAFQCVTVQRLAGGADNPYYKSAEVLTSAWLDR